MKSKLVRCTIPTPVGALMALATDQALVALEFEQPGRQALLEARLRRFFPGVDIVDVSVEHPVLTRTAAWLAAYFAGRHTEPAPALDLRGTPFERRVWDLLRAIPLGGRATYGELARRLGKSAGARAVGGASRRNPVSLIVPCHRVVGADGSLTGYGGGLENKGWLLRHEEQLVTSQPSASP